MRSIRRFDATILSDRLRHGAATALGLCLVVLMFVYLVPRRPEIAAYFAEARQAAFAAREAETAGAAAEEIALEPAGAENGELRGESGLPDRTEPAPVQANGPTPEDKAEIENITVASTEAAAKPDLADRLLPRPVALDATTILFQRGRLRLDGVAPMPLNRRCGGDGSEGWFCGAEARTQLRAWLRSRTISCRVPAGFGEMPGETSGTCDLAGEDVGRWLVANGWAEAEANGPYAEAENKAKADKVGIWAERRPGL